MKRPSKKRAIALVLLGTMTASCGIFGRKNLAKRYANNSKGIYRLASNPSSFANVVLHSLTVRPTAAPTIIYNVLSLSPQGQAEFIKSIAAKSLTKKELADQLNANFNFSKENNLELKIIPKTIKKSLVFTVNRPYYLSANNSVTFNMMGDRIAFLELAVNIAPNQHVSFDSWDRFVTDLTTLNLGKVTSAQQWSASVDLSAKGSLQSSLSGNDANANGTTGDNNVVATAAQTLPDGSTTNTTTADQANSSSTNKSKTTGSSASAELGGSANLSFSDKYETSLDLTTRIIKLSGTMEEKKITLRQESGPGIDLSGNVIVSVDYALEDDWAPPVNFIKFKEFNDSLNRPIDPRRLRTSFMTLLFPDIRNDIVGTMDFSFLYRQVNRGNKHLPEARHKVTFWYGDVPSPVLDSIPAIQRIILVKATDIRPKAFTLQNGANRLTLNGTILRFETPQEAIKFLGYIGNLAAAGGNIGAFQIAGAPITNATLAAIRIVTENL